MSSFTNMFMPSSRDLLAGLFALGLVFMAALSWNQVGLSLMYLVPIKNETLLHLVYAIGATLGAALALKQMESLRNGNGNGNGGLNDVIVPSVADDDDNDDGSS